MNNASSKSFANCIRYPMIGVDFMSSTIMSASIPGAMLPILSSRYIGMRRSARCDVVGVTGGKGIAVELRGLVCLVQGCKDGERGAGAEIGAKTDANRALLL